MFGFSQLLIQDMAHFTIELIFKVAHVLVFGPLARVSRVVKNKATVTGFRHQRPSLPKSSSSKITTHSRLLSLPCEIRYRIFRELLGDDVIHLVQLHGRLHHIRCTALTPSRHHNMGRCCLNQQENNQTKYYVSRLRFEVQWQTMPMIPQVSVFPVAPISLSPT